MTKYRPLFIIILSFLLIFLVRLYFVGGFHGYYTDVLIEDLGTVLRPERTFLANQFKEVLPAEQTALLSGILLGEKSELPKSLKDALIATSTIHIVVVSGQNLSMLVGFCLLLAPIFGRRRIILVSLFIIVLYSLLTGLQIPVLRAAIMSTFVLIGILLGRDRQNAWILTLTASLMLIFEPNWLFSISFQLSFLATFAVIIVAPILMRHLLLPEFIRQDLAVSIASQALTMPIIAANFGEVSVVGVLANLFVLWTIPLVMLSGFALLISQLIFSVLSPLVAIIPNILLTYFLYIIQFFTLVPFSTLRIAELHPLFWVGYYILTFGVVSLLAKKPSSSNLTDSEIPSRYL